MILLMRHHNGSDSKKVINNSTSTPYLRKLDKELQENNRAAEEEKRIEGGTLVIPEKDDASINYFMTLLNACEKSSTTSLKYTYEFHDKVLRESAKNKKRLLFPICLKEDENNGIALSDDARSNMKQYLKS